MLMFKRFVCVILSALMLLPLVSCGQAEPYEPDLKGTTESNWVEVIASEEHQTIQGFGGINFPCWIDDLTEDQRETAFKTARISLDLPYSGFR